MLNFFLDHEIIPIEINLDAEPSYSELCDLFESVKSKIGPPRNYGLSKKEEAEIQRIKDTIAREEAAEKVEEERKLREATAAEKEAQLKEWVCSLINTSSCTRTWNTKCLQIDQMMEQKRKEVMDIEQRCLPVRHYLFKYILPNVTSALTKVASVRPKNPVVFLAKLLLSQSEGETFDEDLDEEVVAEFRKLVEDCDCKNDD